MRNGFIAKKSILTHCLEKLGGPSLNETYRRIQQSCGLIQCLLTHEITSKNLSVRKCELPFISWKWFANSLSDGKFDVISFLYLLPCLNIK